jgi:hypothetical protein
MKKLLTAAQSQHQATRLTKNHQQSTTSVRSHFTRLLALTIFGLPLSLPLSATAQTSAEQACYNNVQGKIAWSRGGSTQWNDGNVRRLCKGVSKPTERIACFNNGINTHNDWSKAINECASAGAAAGAPVALIPGKQCVFNNGAFSVKVDWYDPSSVVFKGKDRSEFNDYSKYEISGKPVQTNNNITLGLKSCTEGANRVAVVRIVGQKIANNAITIAAGTLTGIATGVAGAFVCVGTAGAGCPAAVAGVTAATSGAVSGIAAALPDVQEIAYLGSPGTTNYVDLSGTIWQVGIANNIPLNNPRGFEKIAAFFDGGEPGPRSISFNNQAGYVAEMFVAYMQKDNSGVDRVVVQRSGQISAGFTKHINVPLAISNTPIQVSIQGVGTIKKEVYKTTVPTNFSGNNCYKSYATIFDAKGSTCR